MRLLGLSGSLRKASYNSALLRAAAELVPEGVTLATRTIAGIPLYNGDDEEERGVPAAVATLKDEIASCDGLLLVTPEYNNSIPGTFKNAIDWASRPPSDVKRVFAGRPVAVIGASPGRFGTMLSQNAWLPVLRTLGMQHWSAGRLLLARAGAAFTAGELADPDERERLRSFLAGFAAFASQAGA
jgi:NAD(P)H-dependent FMN reductase